MLKKRKWPLKGWHKVGLNDRVGHKTVYLFSSISLLRNPSEKSPNTILKRTYISRDKYCQSPTQCFVVVVFPKRFFVLDNGMLKYSKSPIDVSNPDQQPMEQRRSRDGGQPQLASLWHNDNLAETPPGSLCLQCFCCPCQSVGNLQINGKTAGSTLI